MNPASSVPLYGLATSGLLLYIDTISNATAMYMQSQRTAGREAAQPSLARSTVETHEVTQYVVLRDEIEVLAVYQIEPGAKALLRLDEWPTGIH